MPTKSWALSLAILTVMDATLSSGAQAAVAIGVQIAPPAPRVEVIPPPRPGYIWAPGYWRWGGRHYHWVPGHWLHRHRGDYYYGPGRWEQGPNGWVFVRPGWHHGPPPPGYAPPGYAPPGYNPPPGPPR